MPRATRRSSANILDHMSGARLHCLLRDRCEGGKHRLAQSRTSRSTYSLSRRPLRQDHGAAADGAATRARRPGPRTPTTSRAPFPSTWTRPCRRPMTIRSSFPKATSVDELPDPVKLDLGFAAYRAVQVTGQHAALHAHIHVRQMTLPADAMPTCRSSPARLRADEESRAVLKKK